MLPLYSLFGLTLRSDVPLPCAALQDPDDRVDVEMAEGTGRQLDELCAGVPTIVEEDDYWTCILYANGAVSVCWKDHFDFVVSSDGGRVFWRRLVEVPDEVLITYLLGQVLSFCLVMRGVEPLHATSVLVDGGAIAFFGDSGHGKSTLAATLLERGSQLLTDDVLVVKFEGGRALAYPSLPRIKLTPESADAVFAGRRSVPMNRFTQKMIFPVEADRHGEAAARLRAIYWLPSESDEPGVSIRSLTPRDEFLSVIQNTFNNSVLHSRRLRQQFAFARQLVSSVSIRVLSFPKQLDLLPSVADAVVNDARSTLA